MHLTYGVVLAFVGADAELLQSAEPRRCPALLGRLVQFGIGITL